MQQRSNTSNRFVRFPEVLEITGYKRSTLYNQIAVEQFPRPIKLGTSRCVAWLKSDIDQWLSDQISDRDSSDTGGL